VREDAVVLGCRFQCGDGGGGCLGMEVCRRGEEESGEERESGRKTTT
jgi:hypothetical protein